MASSALVFDQGKQVRFRVGGRFFELSQETLRAVLGLPDGPSGLGISIEDDRFCFEFTDQEPVEMTLGG
jgi:hypothetical protein